MLSLRFSELKIQHWADRNLDDGSDEFATEVGPAARARGYIALDEFLAMCAWKSPRSKPLCAANSSDLVREVTTMSLAAKSEELRIGTLLLLHGVSWPTASVLLHFCSPEQYPILDFRALWTLKTKQPSAYSFRFWWSYVEACRSISERNRVSMRTLDRALWQYSKERQPA